MRVGVPSGPSWSTTTSTPTVVVKEGYVTIPQVDLGVTYDIGLDDQRFLLIKGPQTSQLTTGPLSIVVVQNWIEELKRLAPIK